MSGRRSGDDRRQWVAPALAALALFAGFAALAVLSRRGLALSAWDARVTEAFVAWRTPGRSHLFWAMTLIGNDVILGPLSFSAVMLLAVWGRRGRAVLLGGGMLVGWGLSEAAKVIVGRVRPPAAGALIALPSSRSMPSSHAFATLVFLALLTYLTWRALRGPAARPARRDKGTAGGACAPASRGTPLLATGRLLMPTAIGVVAAAIAGLIGVSRVYLGVHWLSDVLGAWCLAGAWVAAYVGVLWGWARAKAWGADCHPPAPRWTRVAAVAVAVVICVVGIVLGAHWGPLLTNV